MKLDYFSMRFFKYCVHVIPVLAVTPRKQPAYTFPDMTFYYIFNCNNTDFYSTKVQHNILQADGRTRDNDTTS